MNNIKNSEIDSRIVDIYWENLKNLEFYIEKEITKAGYLIGLQGTILFIAAMKLGNINNIYIKIIIIFLFILSGFLSYLTIVGNGKIRHLGFIDTTKFDRREVLDKILRIYFETKKEYIKKVKINKYNMFLQGITLFLILIILLFPNIL